MKNAFYLILKALFFLEIFTFLSWRCGNVEKRLDKKVMVNLKIYGNTDWANLWQQMITIQILPNIARSKSNQSVSDIGQLIKYNENIFLQKSCRKWGRETTSRPLFVFFKNLHITWKQVVSTFILIYFGKHWLGQK